MSRFYVQASEYELIASLDVTADDVSDAISRFNQHFKGRVDGWKDVKSSTHLVINLGLTQVIPEKVAKVRGFTANSHDRWAGNPCAGGSGGSSIRSFAGNAAGWN